MSRIQTVQLLRGFLLLKKHSMHRIPAKTSLGANHLIVVNQEVKTRPNLPPTPEDPGPSAALILGSAQRNPALGSLAPIPIDSPREQTTPIREALTLLPPNPISNQSPTQGLKPKSYLPAGSTSINPPPSLVSAQPNVKRVVTNQILLYLNIEEIWLVRKRRI
jgi:hypothetical protein